MSGICAVWRKDNPLRAADTLASINAGLVLAAAERPVQQCAGGVGVGVSARFTEQQLHNNGRVLIACDADLVNEDELAEAIGHRLGAPEDSSTAALLAALYERQGCAFVEKLRGGFSLVLWDIRERRFVAAIDGFGIKRLVYYRDSEVLVAASRIDALMRSGLVDQEINPKAIANVLNFTSNLGPDTIFARVERLVPGAILVAEERNVRVEKYWDMRYGLGSSSKAGRLSREVESVGEDSGAIHCKKDPQH